MNMIVIPMAFEVFAHCAMHGELLIAIKGSWRSVCKSGLARIRLVELISKDKKKNKNYTHSSV